jgi:predicted nucleotidyltransferase
MLSEVYSSIVDKLLQECHAFYGDRLVSFCLYGSVARGTMNYTSDIDFLLVVENLPDGNFRRFEEFRQVEQKIMQSISDSRKSEVYIELSPVIKSPEEVRFGSLLFLDMLEDGKILFDRKDFLNDYFDEFRAHLKELGAHRVVKGETWYWILKEPYVPGEVFEVFPPVIAESLPRNVGA